MNCDLTSGLGAVSKIPCDETIAQLDDVAIPVMAAVNAQTAAANPTTATNPTVVNTTNVMNPAANSQGRPAVNREPLTLDNQTQTPVSPLPYESMTSFVTPANGNGNGRPVSTAAAGTDAADPPIAAPGISAIGGFPSGPPDIFQDVPQFSVPNNPLLPPGYQEVLDYGSLQYLNGFLRTQIGRYVRVEYVVGSTLIEEMMGYLVGVGINYLLLQEISTDNIIAMDFYTVKSVYFYYTKTDLPTNATK